MNDQDRISRIRADAEKILFKIPGVHGVGIGHKHTKGQYTSELSIKVYIRKKRSLSEIPPAELIPPVIDGVKTDVVETGPPEPSANPDTKQYRPARGGTCIQLQDVEQVAGGTLHHVATGTMGCIAKTTGNPSIIVGVTNQHVLAVGGVKTPGQAIPAEIEGRPFAERIGRIVQAFVKYGSTDLARDCLDSGAILAELGGRTYDEVLAMVRASVSTKTPAMTISAAGV